MAKTGSHPALGTGRALEAFQRLSELPERWRETILALAGQNPDKLARSVAAAFGVLNAALSASKVQRLVVSQGKDVPAKVEEFTDPDWDVRLDAVEKLGRLVGIQPPRPGTSTASSAAGQPVTVNVVLRDVARPLLAPVVDSKSDAILDGTLDASSAQS